MHFFQELKKADNNKIGKKALRLKIIQKKGINIPKSFVINTDFQDNALDDEQLNKIVSLIKKEFKNLVVVRSSATCEDSQFFSFAGQYDSFLGLNNFDDIKKAILMIYASFKSKNAKLYSKLNNINLKGERMSILVQELIPVEKSGVFFTSNPVNHDHEAILEYDDGFGDKIISGEKKPKTMIIKKTENIKDAWVKEMFQKGKKIEKIFIRPQDIEWGLVGKKIYIFQSRDITTPKEEDNNFKILSRGIIGRKGLTTGKIKIISNDRDFEKINKNTVVYLKNKKHLFSNLDIIKKVRGVIMSGGLLSHFSVILREFNIPFILIDHNLEIKNNEEVILDLNDKKIGTIYINKKYEKK